jgi:hypothetical protein
MLLVWAIDCLNIGDLFLRDIYATDRKWDDAKETRENSRRLAARQCRHAAPSRRKGPVSQLGEAHQ